LYFKTPSVVALVGRGFSRRARPIELKLPVLKLNSEPETVTPSVSS